MLPFFPRTYREISEAPAAGLPISACDYRNESTCRPHGRALEGDAAAARDDWDRSYDDRWRDVSPIGSALDEGVREHERYRMAQQIHDDLGGILTGLKACISVALERRSRAGVDPDPLLLDASMLADLAFATVRKIGANLRPTILEEMDLWEALEWQVAGLCRRTDIDFDYFVDAALMLMPLGDERAMLVFRVICEALTNIERHARASKVSLRLFAEHGMLTVLVRDNGVGMRQPAGPFRSTFGIAGMQQRAQDVGGEVAVSSGAGGGTTVRLAVPLARGGGD
jgi:two-component system sensor histidine kinase UhpB